MRGLRFICGSSDQLSDDMYHHHHYQDPEKKKAWAVPWIGIAVIVGSLFMPYVSFFVFEISGLEMIVLSLDGFGSIDLTDSGDSGGGDEMFEPAGGDDEMFEAGPLKVAILMLILSPIFYSLMALLSLFCMLFKRHPVWVGGLHVVYFGIFMICSFISGVDLGILGSYSVHGDLAGMGFFAGGLAGILLMVKS